MRQIQQSSSAEYCVNLTLQTIDEVTQTAGGHLRHGYFSSLILIIVIPSCSVGDIWYLFMKYRPVETSQTQQPVDRHF